MTGVMMAMADPIVLTVQEEAPVALTPEQVAVVNAVSPTVITEQIEGGAVITVTDLHGVHPVTLYNGENGRGIANTVLNDNYTLTITYTDGTSYTTPSIRGVQGRGIVSIAKIGSSGLVDAYMITYSDGDPSIFYVTNGADGISPTVEVAPITGGYRITFTDKNGPHTFDILNGKDGPGVASGGTQGQMLVKKSGTDYDTEWGDPPSVPVQDVQVNGTSILNNGVANVPAGSTSDYGVFKLNLYGGLQVGSDGLLKTSGASASLVKAGTDTTRPLTPSRISDSAFYGLAKSAGADMASSSNPVGTYTEDAKKAIREMFGIPNFDSEVIYDGTTTEDLASVVISTDNNGLPFELRAFKVFVKLAASTTGTNDYITFRATMKKDITDVPFTHTFPTLKMSNASGSLNCYEFEAFPGGLYFNRGYVSSMFSSTSGAQSSMPMDNLVKSATAIDVRQYSASTTLIPSGTRIIIIGIRI